MTIETGLSDLHQITITVMRASYNKLKPKIISYRKYIKFNNHNIRKELINEQKMHNNQLSVTIEIL